MPDRRTFLTGLAALPLSPIPALVIDAGNSGNDARLAVLTDRLETLYRACEALPSKADDALDDFASGFGPLEEEIADTPADTLKGVLAKIRALDVPATGDHAADSCHNIMCSICEDITRLHANGAAYV